MHRIRTFPKNSETACVAYATYPTQWQRPSEKTTFQTACFPYGHAEPVVGCVAPRRRTRSLPHNASVLFSKNQTACVACAHALPETTEAV
ncbi:hypothetical protein HMPREF9123_2171 [Neisseria bacilliformis ATCC BAA-1200]|uniref:Uncharacterized protein n=1 Tax=Neisseria bacilliformis ATCC BAA-1200 TaxID=888742 RepID=F2BEL5_9NEIS|nr:hypothetical protein HMPREF9123_2171 [Neisseria bacilliformis ATCC BAA-1200]